MKMIVSEECMRIQVIEVMDQVVVEFVVYFEYYEKFEYDVVDYGGEDNGFLQVVVQILVVFDVCLCQLLESY